MHISRGAHSRFFCDVFSLLTDVYFNTSTCVQIVSNEVEMFGFCKIHRVTCAFQCYCDANRIQSLPKISRMLGNFVRYLFFERTLRSKVSTSDLFGSCRQVVSNTDDISKCFRRLRTLVEDMFEFVQNTPRISSIFNGILSWSEIFVSASWRQIKREHSSP